MQLSDFLPPILTRRGQTKAIDFGEGGLAAYLNMPLSEANYTSTRNFQALVASGYSRNPYLYRAITLLARSIAGIPWVLYRDRDAQDRGKQIAGHPAVRLLNIRANALQSASTFWQYVVTDSLLAGHVFIYAVRTTQGVAELHTLRPDWVSLKQDHGTPVAYEYGSGVDKQTFALDDVLHIPEVNPLRSGSGVAPAMVVARAADQMTASDDWNTALMQNMARPSGLLSPDAMTLTPEQQESLKRELQEKYGGPKNAGKPLVPRGPMKWQPMGATPAEMDWLAGKSSSVRSIGVGLGIAPELLGDGAAKTYSNVAQARAALYTEEIFPRMDFYAAALSMWLLPMFALDEHYTLGYDIDRVEAVQEDRGQVWDRAVASVSGGVLTPNEAREMLGYDAVEGGDHLLIPGTLEPLETALNPPAPVAHSPTIAASPDGAPTDRAEPPGADDDMPPLAPAGEGKSLVAPSAPQMKVLAIHTQARAAETARQPLYHAATATVRQHLHAERGRVRSAASGAASVAAARKAMQHALDAERPAWARLMAAVGSSAATAATSYQLDDWRQRFTVPKGYTYDPTQDKSSHTATALKTTAPARGNDVVDTTGNRLDAATADASSIPEVLDSLDSCYDTWGASPEDDSESDSGGTRAGAIAAAAILAFWSMAQSDIMDDLEAAGVTELLPGQYIAKTWATVGDDRVRPTHDDADGQQVAASDSFIVGGEELDYPCDPAGSSSETLGCRCSAVYDVVSD